MARHVMSRQVGSEYRETEQPKAGGIKAWSEAWGEAEGERKRESEGHTASGGEDGNGGGEEEATDSSTGGRAAAQPGMMLR